MFFIEGCYSEVLLYNATIIVSQYVRKLKMFCKTLAGSRREPLLIKPMTVLGSANATSNAFENAGYINHSFQGGTGGDSESQHYYSAVGASADPVARNGKATVQKNDLLVNSGGYEECFGQEYTEPINLKDRGAVYEEPTAKEGLKVSYDPLTRVKIYNLFTKGHLVECQNYQSNFVTCKRYLNFLVGYNN